MYYSNLDDFYKWIDYTVKKGIRNAVKKNSRNWFNQYKDGIGTDIVSIDNCFPIDSEDYLGNLSKLDLFMRMAADDAFAERLRSFIGKHVHMGRDGVADAVHAMQREIVREYVHQNTCRYLNYWNQYERKIRKVRKANRDDFDLWIDTLVRKSIENAVKNGSDTWFEYMESVDDVRVYWRRLREGLPDFKDHLEMVDFLDKLFLIGAVDPSFQYMLETKTNGRFPFGNEEFKGWIIALRGGLVCDDVYEHASEYMEYWNDCVKGNGNV